MYRNNTEKYNKPNGKKGHKQGSQQKFNQFKGQQHSQNQNQGKQLKCYNCGENFNGDYEQNHKPRCKARDKTCSNCKWKGHLWKMCKSKEHSQDRQNINYTCADGIRTELSRI